MNYGNRIHMVYYLIIVIPDMVMFPPKCILNVLSIDLNRI